MAPWKSVYSRVEKVDPEDEEAFHEPQVERRPERQRLFLTILVAIACLATGFGAGSLTRILAVHDVPSSSTGSSELQLPSVSEVPSVPDTPMVPDLPTLPVSPTVSCKEPTVRREWRSFTSDERAEYVAAVKCLATIPSTIGLNGTLYDDFSWLHRNIGQYSHEASSFLPFHRYVLHKYENVLSEYCGFTGVMPYWDWSLDWVNPAQSSIWDPETGFGGDGDPSGEITVGGGRCVIDGPFTDLKPIFYNFTYNLHCISRGFRTASGFGSISGWDYRPEGMGELLRHSTYDEFVHDIELKHDFLHNGIGGDFMAFTASNDPLFFLHHAQLDRLWWQWQNIDPNNRLKEYTGHHFNNSTTNATVEDRLTFAGFMDDISVFEVMNTQGDMLCYHY